MLNERSVLLWAAGDEEWIPVICLHAIHLSQRLAVNVAVVEGFVVAPGTRIVGLQRLGKGEAQLIFCRARHVQRVPLHPLTSSHQKPHIIM
jgi:hypothetical protein